MAGEKIKSSKKGKKKNKSGGFQSLGLSYNVLGGIMRLGYKVPTPVQRKSLPVALSGQDLVCMARTGSGKTAAFLIPLIERLKEHDVRSGVRGIVLSPTRELAIQTMKFAKGIGKLTGLRFCLIVGGDSLEGQFEALSQRPDVVVGTPGRLMHLLQEVPEFTLKSVEMLVFDEADRLFEMGFAEQLNEIIKQVPEERQSLLFSATLPKLLVQFARAGLREPQLIRLDTDTKISPNLCLSFFTIKSADKPAAFIFLVRDLIPKKDLTIVFVATKHHAEFLHLLLTEIGVDSAVIYGAMDQESRNSSLERFKRQKVKLLIVTDVAARGIDIPLLNNVVNYSFPCASKLFVHRVGRAARQGRSGVAFSLVDPEELPYMVDLHLFLGRKPQNIYHDNDQAEKPSSDSQSPEPQGFDLSEMSPEMVYYGGVPQSVLDSENEFCRQLYARSGGALGNLHKVCENAMKQVRRTRTDPSKTSIHRAKEILRNQVHPLLRKFIPKGVLPEEMKACSGLMDMIHNFRPKETIFEVKTNQTGGKKVEEKVTDMMRNLRKDHYSVKKRNRLKAEEEENALNNSGGQIEENELKGEVNKDESSEVGNSSKEELETASQGAQEAEVQEIPKAKPLLSIPENKNVGKQRLSKAQRKRLKKLQKANPGASIPISRVKTEEGKQPEEPSNKKTTYRDEENYIGYGGTIDQSEQEQFFEGALQPKSDLKDADKGIANLLEEALLDINPDSVEDMQRKKQIMHWDTRKKKYIKTTIAELASQRGNKKLRTESGAIMNKKMVPTGEIYQKWKSKTHKEIAGEGIEEEEEDARPKGRTPLAKGKARINAHVKDEVKNTVELRKERKRRRDMQLKNMPKKKRLKIMQKQKEKRKEFKQRFGTKPGNIRVVLRR